MISFMQRRFVSTEGTDVVVVNMGIKPLVDRRFDSPDDSATVVFWKMFAPMLL